MAGVFLLIVSYKLFCFRFTAEWLDNKSKFSVEDIKENTEVRAWDEKGVVMITRGRAEQEVHSLANNDQNKSVNNIAQILQ